MTDVSRIEQDLGELRGAEALGELLGDILRRLDRMERRIASIETTNQTDSSN